MVFGSVTATRTRAPGKFDAVSPKDIIAITSDINVLLEVSGIGAIRTLGFPTIAPTTKITIARTRVGTIVPTTKITIARTRVGTIVPTTKITIARTTRGTTVQVTSGMIALILGATIARTLVTMGVTGSRPTTVVITQLRATTHMRVAVAIPAIAVVTAAGGALVGDVRHAVEISTEGSAVVTM
jgi:hypothetical protein